MNQYQSTVELINEVGLHARPASDLVRTASDFESEVLLEKENDDRGLEANAKSISEVLSLGAEQGDVILIKTKGKDAEEALEKLVNLVNKKFEQ